MAGVHGALRKDLRVTLILGLVVMLVAAGFLVVGHLRSAQADTNSTAPPTPLSVTSMTPTGTGVAAGSTIAVRFSTALAPNSPLPTLNPTVPGSSAVLSPSVLQYQAVGPLDPGSTETLTVPGGSGGVTGSQRQHLDRTVTSQFTVALGSTLRLQQLLAELGYLQLTFTTDSPVTSPTQLGNDQVGTLTWRWTNEPVQLTSLWTPGANNVITQGAVMNFESQNG